MDNNQNPIGVTDNTKTAPFDINDVRKVVDDAKKNIPLAGAVHTHKNVGKKIGPKTMKRRAGALCSSRLMLLFCIFMSVSTVLTAFRGYFTPFTVYLTVQRFAMAACAWTVYFTSGKYLATVFSWLPIVESVASAVMLLIFAACTGYAVTSSGADKASSFMGLGNLASAANKSGMWALVVAASFVAMAYCIYLFKRRERLVLCNIRDAAQHGFAFSGGSKRYVAYGMIVACVMPISFIALKVMGGFDGLPYVSEDAAALMNGIYNTGSIFVLNLIGVFVHSAAVLVSTMIVGRYEMVVKRYKEQREAQKKLQEEDAQDEEAATPPVQNTPVKAAKKRKIKKKTVKRT